jgi:hypothetical protein
VGDFVRVSVVINIKKLLAAARALGLAVLLCANAAAAEETLPPVPVKIGDHPTYSRIVFECPKLLAYHVTSLGDEVRIVFDTKAKLSLPAVKSPLVKKMTAATEHDTQKVDITLAGGATFKHYRLMRKIIVDVLTGAKPAPQKPSSPPAMAANTAETKKPPEVPPKAAAEIKPAAIIPPPVVITAPPPTITPAPTVATAPVKEVVQETAPPLTEPSDIAATKLPGQTTPAPPSWDLSVTKPETDLPAAPKSAAPLPQDNGKESASISLSSLTPMRLAVFERFDALWIVTDSTSSTMSAPMMTGPMAAFIQPPKILKFPQGTAFRYTMPKTLYPLTSKRGLVWNISLLTEPPPEGPAGALKTEVDPQTGQASITIALKGAGDALSLEDPEIGDTLLVVPTSKSQQAAHEHRLISELEIIPAATGMVVRPLRDGVTIQHVIPAQKKNLNAVDVTGKILVPDPNENAERDNNSFILVTAPGGLSVTTEMAGSAALIGAPDDESADDGSRLFDFPNWQRGGIKKLQENKRALQNEIAAATTPEDRQNLLTQLATLYFSNNLGQETLGVLDLVQTENPEVDKSPDFMALRGAANALAGHYKEALQDLAFPAIQQRPEVAMWVGFAAAATEQWRMADRSFPKSNRMLLQYPDSIAVPFTIYMAESALRLGHADMAQQLLDSINKSSEALTRQNQAAIDYLRGETFAQQGNREKAAVLWQSVAGGLDRLYHTKASLSLTRLLLQQKKITPKEAIDRIDSLRFAWRGDGLEVEVLHTLGALKVQNRQILSGLEDMKQAADLADSLLDDSTPIRDDMKQIISDLFLSDSTGIVTPLEVVSIYNEFGTLMPAGADSSRAALNFADNLIRIDLLDRAAAVIEEQIRGGLPDDTTIALGTKLAAVYLLDSRPSQAEAALKETEKSGISGKAREERTLLRARAQSQLNQTADAINTLSTLNSKNAQKLKADVLWHAHKWGEAAGALEALLPDPTKPVSDEDAAFVVNAAVAYKLANLPDKLKEIKSKYTTALAPTKLASTFGVVTRDGGSSNLADRDSMLKIAGEVDMFKGFLENYKTGPGGS